MAFTKQRWLIGGLAVIAVLLLVSEHGKQTASESGTSSTGGTRPCTVTVTADVLNVRSRPDGNAPVTDIYHKGDMVSADRITQSGFRQLRPGHWVAQEFVQPTAGSDCG